MKAEEFIEGVDELVKSYKQAKKSLEYARFHILNKIRAFEPKELECMAMDGIICHSDIPEDLRTEHSKFMAEHGD